MSVDYGLQAIPPSGGVLSSPSALGAVFVGRVVCSITSGTQTLDYASVPFGSLFAVQFGEGVHTWAISNNGGLSRLTFTYAKATYQSAKNTTLYLYASNTVEGDYGINALNDLGQRVVSTVYPNCRFIQKATLDGVPHAYSTFASTGGWYMRTNTFSYTATSVNHFGLVFWSIPSSTDTTIWWSGDPDITLPGATAYSRMYYYSPSGGTAPTVWPEAFVFEVGPYMAANSTYGIRVYDAAGNIMYDGGTPQLVILGRLDSINFNTSGLTYTIPSGVGTPAIVFPQYIKQSKFGGCDKDGAANLHEQWGMFRRNGSTLYSDIMLMENDPQGYDCRDTNTTYYYGNRTGLFVPFINATQYGGAAI